MTLIVCPGQGSQVPGFLSGWLEIPVFRETIEMLQEVLELDLVRIGTTADAEEIKDTKIAQPLIVASGIASFAALKLEAGDKLVVSGVAGHSVGEITAASLAGIMNAETAMRFVKLRGEQMANSAASHQTSMAAVVGGDEVNVLKAIESAGLAAANFNGPGQIVAAGSKDLIEALVANPPSGTRVIQLQVAGAFHTEFMEAAKKALHDFAKNLDVEDPKFPIWTNKDGALISSGPSYLDLLVGQVTSPVRWDQTMAAMARTNQQKMIELLPGGTLSGIAKRAMPGVTAVALKSPDDIGKAIELLER